MKLKDYQEDALNKLQNGSILCGGVGSGKSLTALAYFYKEQGGKSSLEKIDILKNPKDLYIITTPKKRDSREWNLELCNFWMSTDVELNKQKNKVVVDSWNNIKKYEDIKNAFFIFDEQRVVGWGTWSKTFIKIARNNNWILLSATPGDKYEDYMPVFIANNFYRNKTEFIREHIVYDYHVNFPKVDRYLDTRRLDRLRSKILVVMDYASPANSNHIDIWVDYDSFEYKRVIRQRTNPYRDEEPIENVSEFCQVLRRIVNEDPSRALAVLDIVKEKKKVIIFYNFDYELEILKNLPYKCDMGKPEVAEWNGHKHQQIPIADCWVYLVQYNSGNEGWNCIETDTMIFYSENYSYRIMTQAAGRIDRMNTLFTDLYFYHLKSRSSIDVRIARAIADKKKFNEIKFVKNWVSDPLKTAV